MEKSIPHTDKNTFFPWLKSISLDYKMIPKITSVTSTSRDPQSVPSAGSSVTLEVYRIMLFLFTDLKKKITLQISPSLSPPFLSLSFISFKKKFVAQAGLQQAIPASVP